MNEVLLIIPHYNKLALLKECLFHIDSQKYDSFDIMIVDNGSVDNSSEYISSLTKNNKRYHSILLNENMGFAYAVNKGIDFSIKNNYKFSILLNNDAFICDNFVKNIVNSISKSDRIFATSSLMLSYKDKNLIDSYGDYYNVLGWSFQGHIAETVDGIIDDETPFSACAGAAIYRNSILKKIGLFDENFFAYLEDVDISYRAKLYGYKINTCKSAVCYHLGSQTSGSRYNEFKVRISARNNIFLIHKNMPIFQILINIFPLFVGHLIKLVFFIKKGFGIDYLFGMVDGLKNVKKLTKVNFANIDFFKFINIEFELLINTFLYIKNFAKRHIN